MVLVELTGQGREQFEAWRRHRRDVLAHLLEPLGEDERVELQRLIEQVLARAAEESYVGARS